MTSVFAENIQWKIFALMNVFVGSENTSFDDRRLMNNTVLLATFTCNYLVAEMTTAAGTPITTNRADAGLLIRARATRGNRFPSRGYRRPRIAERCRVVLSEADKHLNGFGATGS